MRGTSEYREEVKWQCTLNLLQIFSLRALVLKMTKNEVSSHSTGEPAKCSLLGRTKKSWQRGALRKGTAETLKFGAYIHAHFNRHCWWAAKMKLWLPLLLDLWRQKADFPCALTSGSLSQVTQSLVFNWLLSLCLLVSDILVINSNRSS